MADHVTLPAKKRIGDKHGVPPENILAVATHTHEAPETRDHNVPVDPRYVQRVIDSIVEATDEALSHLFEATVHAGLSEAGGFSFNKLFRLKDGREVMGLYATGGQEVGRAGPVDPSVQTLALFDTDLRLRGAAVNFGCHADTLAGADADMVSADWPGEMVRNLSGVYGNDTTWLFLQGPCGDIGASDDLPHYRTNYGEGKTIQVGRGVAGAAAMAIETDEPLMDLRLAAAQEEFEAPYYTRTPEFFAEVARKKAELEALKARGEKPGYVDEHWIKRAESWPYDGKTFPVRVQCFRIGDVALVGLPGEVFTAFGLEIKRYSPFRRTFVVELASCQNGFAAYQCPADQADRGAYGELPAMSRRLAAGTGRRMADSAIRVLHRLWDEA